MGVNVDESGRDNHALCVDARFCGWRAGMGADIDDLVFGDRNIADERGFICPGVDRPAADDEVGRLCGGYSIIQDESEGRYG
jgi:hypothetical protein